MNLIELYVVNYLLFAPTRLASARNGHLKRERAVAFKSSIVYYDIQSSRIILIKLAKLRPFIVFIIIVRLYQSLNLAIVNTLPLS